MTVKIGAIQASTILDKDIVERINNKNLDLALIDGLKQKNIEKYTYLIAEAAKEQINILCLPELFAGPFFAAVPRGNNWRLFAEPDNGHTVKHMQLVAKKHNMVLIVPFYEKDNDEYYNTVVVIDEKGIVLGKYRKLHIPKGDGFHEKDYFKKGNLGLPVFDTTYGKIGVYICYDRHFPMGFRVLRKKGAQVVFVPSATVESTSQYIWESEARIRAYDNKIFTVFINRTGKENIGELAHTRFYGSTLIVDPTGRVIKKASKDKDEIVFAEVELEKDVIYARERYPIERDKINDDEYYQDTI